MHHASLIAQSAASLPTMASPDADCAALTAKVYESLAKPAMRDAIGGQPGWLRDWHFPSSSDVADAEAAADACKRAGCLPRYPNPWLPPAAALLPNLKLYLSPCLTQCGGSAHAYQLWRCGCRACSSAASWPVFVDSLCSPASSLSAFMEPAWCTFGRQITASPCQQEAHHSNHSAELIAEKSARIKLPLGMRDPTGEVLLTDMDGSAVGRCRTAFNESCCPTDPASGLQCGGAARGRCVPIRAWMAAQALAASGKCAWPAWFAAARCQCTYIYIYICMPHMYICTGAPGPPGSPPPDASARSGSAARGATAVPAAGQALTARSLAQLWLRYAYACAHVCVCMHMYLASPSSG